MPWLINFDYVRHLLTSFLVFTDLFPDVKHSLFVWRVSGLFPLLELGKCVGKDLIHSYCLNIHRGMFSGLHVLVN